MSMPNFGDALRFEDLTQEEQILHHNAGMVEKDLRAYRDQGDERTQPTWRRMFIKHLVIPKFQSPLYIGLRIL